jgi:hypothetical protein
LAIELGLRAADGLFLLKLSYDEAFAKYTPGIQLHLEVLDRFDNFDGVQWIDSCTFEGNETMLRMYPDRRPVGALVVAVGGVPDRGVLRLVGWTRRTLGRRAAAAADAAPDPADVDGVPG